MQRQQRQPLQSSDLPSLIHWSSRPTKLPPTKVVPTTKLKIIICNHREIISGRTSEKVIGRTDWQTKKISEYRFQLKLFWLLFSQNEKVSTILIPCSMHHGTALASYYSLQHYNYQIILHLNQHYTGLQNQFMLLTYLSHTTLHRL